MGAIKAALDDLHALLSETRNELADVARRVDDIETTLATLLDR